MSDKDTSCYIYIPHGNTHSTNTLHSHTFFSFFPAIPTTKHGERYTEEERELFREIARLKGTLQRLNNYFGGRQYREVFEENQALINELKKILSR